MKESSQCILAIETATSACSAALLVNGELTQRHEVGSNIHSKVLLEMIQDLLLTADADVKCIDAVAVGQGPGSFTGLRIGVGVGQGIAFGVGCPMIGVSSLDALALDAELELPNFHILAGIDARMGEVYWCEYLNGPQGVERLGELRVTPPQEIASKGEACVLVGNAWAEYASDLDAALQSQAMQQVVEHPRASSILTLAQHKLISGDVIEPALFAPIYVRDNVAKKSSKPLPGLRS